MKVVSQPYTFVDGHVLDPDDLNRVWRYKQEALADATARRYVESVFPLSFVKDCATGYTNLDTPSTRTFSFTAPADLYVTRAFLNGVFSAINAEIKITITKNSTGTTPDGCTDPWLNVAADAPTGEEVRDYNAARFKLESGERYDVLLDSSAAFTVTRLDVHFHVLSDRFGFSAAPSFQPTLANESVGGTKATQDANDTAFGTQVGNLVEDNYAAVCFPLHDTSVNSSSFAGRKFPLPRIDTGRSTAKVVQMSFQIELDSAVTGNYLAQITDGAGTIFNFAIVGITSPATTGYSVATFTRSIQTAVSGSAADTSADYFVEVTSQYPVSATIRKAFVTLWIK